MMVVNKVDMMATEMVTFEEMLAGNKGRRHEDSWGKNILDRGKGECKGPEAGACPICWSHSKKISVGSRVRGRRKQG